MLRLILRPLRQVARLLLALLILFEEWGWEPLQRAMAALGRLPVLRWVEAGIRRLPPWPALALFIVPGLMLLPVKLAAVWLISQGRPLLGLAVLVAAKLMGTALVARLYALTQPALMRLGWFVVLHARWLTWKDALLGWVRVSTVWRSARALRLRLRRGLPRDRRHRQ